LFKRPERWLLVMALVFGAVYAFLVPPFQVPDETSHFYRAYHLSQGYLMGATTADHRLGGALPRSLAILDRSFRPLRYQYDTSISIDSLLRASHLPLHPEDRIFVDFANTGYYAPLPYLPYAAVLRILRSLRLPPLWLLYAGRLTGLLVWTVSVYQAIRLLPYHRWTLATAALLPASLFIHAGLSGDTLTNAFAFLLIALQLRLIYDPERPFHWKEGFWLLVLSTTITVSKVVYAPLVLLSLLIPRSRFRTARHYWAWKTLLILLNGAILFAWYYYAGDKFIPYDQYHPLYRDGQQLNPGVQPRAQLAYILKHPLGFARTLLLSFWETIPATTAHYTGKFGWEKNYLPAPLVALLAASLLFAALFENNENARPACRHRLTFLGIALWMSIALATVLYMQWHTVGNPRITSLGGRYFIPILPLCWLALKQNRYSVPQRRLTAWLQLVILLSLGWGVVGVLQRYYL
jgi:uncharacterized membrane protein